MNSLLKNWIVMLALLVAFSLIGCANEAKLDGLSREKAVSPLTVHISIKGPKEIGSILAKTKMNYRKGDTVLDILLKAAKNKKIEVDYTGKGAMAYIIGIDNVYEFDYGAKSGWNFKVNGKKISQSAGNVKVNKNDRIEWIYLKDFTEGK